MGILEEIYSAADSLKSVSVIGSGQVVKLKNLCCYWNGICKLFIRDSKQEHSYFSPFKFTFSFCRVHISKDELDKSILKLEEAPTSPPQLQGE